jgi:transposase-like protein
MNIEELIKDLDPVTIIEFKNYLSENLTKLCSEKNSNSKIISTYRQDELFCKHCGCKYNKNGKTKSGVQKYICSGCKTTISETTNTIIYHSKLSFEIWSNIIDNLINGFSVRRIAEENNISILTSFRIRHKVLLALKTFVKNIRLSGGIQSDEKYFSINLKGTKPNNMPRFSKKRTSTSLSYKGKSHHKICVVSSIDENDNLLLQITGLGRCTTEMLENSLGKKLNNAKIVNADSASAYQKFCLNHDLELQAVPSGFHSNGQINIAEINGVHSQLETWLSKFRGVSTRHLQEYLDWFTYIFIMKKRFNLNKLKTESYSSIVIDNNYIKSNKIFSIKMPIDLNVAYAEYANQS